MARHKDANWNLADGIRKENGTIEYDWNSVFAALLMDLRDELKRLNAVLHCSNFLSIPQKLDDIRRNTTKKRKRHAS